ncbi:MAG TPA: hypothetical protein VGB83_01075 [Actinomycetota bacterium]
MKQRALWLAVVAGLLSLGVATGSSAHTCDTDVPDESCEESKAVEDWRGSYVPLFEPVDNSREARFDQQRWHEECAKPDGESAQMCQWAYGGVSAFPNRGTTESPGETTPNELHVGFAASHCFLFEFAHQCEDHAEERGEGVHDRHGGAIYIDICGTPNLQSKHCRNGIVDTQIGITVIDHNACGTFVPIVACTDEYHVLRPFDPDYTQAQMEQSLDAIQVALADPKAFLREWFCGHEEFSSTPDDPDTPEDEYEAYGDCAFIGLINGLPG